MDSPVLSRLDLAKEIARSVGRDLLERFHADTSNLEEKASPLDLVSDADRQAEEQIFAGIMQRFPQDSFLGEEFGLRGGDGPVRWITDPLDGTINWVRQDPNWVLMLCAEDADGPLLSVIYRPMTDTLFYGGRGVPAAINDLPLPAPAVSPARHVGEALVAGVWPVGTLIEPGQRRAYGTVGAEVCALLERRLDMVVFDIDVLNLWDFEPVRTLARSAGLCAHTQDTDRGQICLLGPAHLIDEWLELLDAQGRLPRGPSRGSTPTSAVIS